MEAKKFSFDSSNPAGLFLQIAVPNAISAASGSASSTFQASADIHSVNLSWSSTATGPTYKIYSSTTSSVTVGSPEITGSASGITGSSFTHSGLGGGETHYYLLEVIQTDGTKSYSKITQATTYYLPSDVASLLIWLSADSGITKDTSNKITTWVDRVGGTPFNNTYVNQEPYWLPNYKNNRPFVKTSNPETRFFTGPALSIAGSSYTIIYVLDQVPGSVSSEGILHLSGPNSLVLKFQSNQFSVFGAGVTFQSNAYATDVTHILTMQFSGSSTTMYRNGALEKTTSDVFPATGNTTTYLGVYFGGAGFEGRIGETLIYNQGLSTTDRIKTECYLSFKYNIAVPHVCN
ncbi:LamG domain-containing protein [Leptospira tipperaryensis]|nr:LamG domain-containing protein [Leptospira tipperaryensis]